MNNKDLSNILNNFHFENIDNNKESNNNENKYLKNQNNKNESEYVDLTCEFENNKDLNDVTINNLFNEINNKNKDINSNKKEINYPNNQNNSDELDYIDLSSESINNNDFNDILINNLFRDLKSQNIKFDKGRVLIKTNDFTQTFYLLIFTIFFTINIAIIPLLYINNCSINMKLILPILFFLLVIECLITLKNLYASIVIDYNSNQIYVEYNILIFKLKKYIYNFTDVVELGVSVYRYFYENVITESIFNLFKKFRNDISYSREKYCSALLILIKDNNSYIPFNVTGYIDGYKRMLRSFELAKKISIILNKPLINNIDYPLVASNYAKHFIKYTTIPINTFGIFCPPKIGVNYKNFYDQASLKRTYWGNLLILGFNPGNRHNFNIDLLLLAWLFILCINIFLFFELKK